ncbi:hypothetical protein BH10PLA2_BH10PLA2_33720 [soil metagenome]
MLANGQSRYKERQTWIEDRELIGRYRDLRFPLPHPFRMPILMKSSFRQGDGAPVASYWYGIVQLRMVATSVV